MRDLNLFLLSLSFALLKQVSSTHLLRARIAVGDSSLMDLQSASDPNVRNEYFDAENFSRELKDDNRQSASGLNDALWTQMDVGDDEWPVQSEDREGRHETYVEDERWLDLEGSSATEARRARRHANEIQMTADERAPTNDLSLEQYVTLNGTSGGEMLHRDSKLFFSLIQILPVRCTTQDNITRSGVCLSSTECSARTGVASGGCAQGLAVCCILQKTCLQSTNINNTFFVNPNYPGADEGAGACSLTINRVNDDICQMRVDFLQLELSQPDANGQCITDFLTVTGGITDAPIICGSNTGQHMYIDVDPNGGSVRLSVDRTAASVGDRVWNVRVAQIPCTSSFRAPRGCLQYFTETSGTIQSFNFNQNIDEEAVPLATRQVSGMDYSACVQMAEGYCSIMWSRNVTAGEFGFTVSHAVDGVDPEIIGTPSASTRGVNCTTDYVVIPGGVDDAGLSSDRFCGYGFPNSVTSSMKPFLLYVRTDANELPDNLNRGFSLDYRQTIC